MQGERAFCGKNNACSPVVYLLLLWILHTYEQENLKGLQQFISTII
jgi:hypothetical protein